MRPLSLLVLSACAAQGSPRPAACDAPNPARLAIDATLVEPAETLDDGGFEEDGLGAGTAARATDAARTGKWGWRGTALSVAFSPERSVEQQLSAWVRAKGAPAQVRLVVTGEKAPPRAAEWVTVGPEWQQLTMSMRFPRPVPSAALGVEASAAVDVDDLSVTAPAWRYADGPRALGGIHVPAQPAAPVHFAMLIHVEDEPALAVGERQWEGTTRVLERLAEVLHRHGGALTIQSELDWIEGAAAAAKRTGRPNTLARFATDFGVHYSTHTHGPRCVDPAGVARSAFACRQHPDWRTSVTDAEVVAYIRTRQEAVRAATGVLPTDHNGNFDVASLAGLQALGVQTLSGFKDKRDQGGLPSLYTNPWRPSGGDALESLSPFLAHAPQGPLVYLPGAGVALTRAPRRLPDQLARVVSQSLRFADAERVGTLYTILAVGAFAPLSGDRAGYLDSPAFAADVGALDAALSRLVDPLVKEGYLRWSSLPEMGAAYLAWEERCR